MKSVGGIMCESVKVVNKRIGHRGKVKDQEGGRVSGGGRGVGSRRAEKGKEGAEKGQSREGKPIGDSPTIRMGK